MRIGFTLAACLALAGCAGGDLAGFGPAVRGGGGGLPPTRAEARPDLMTPPGRRELGFALRTFVEAVDGSLDEVQGATCTISGGAFEARVVTPARVIVPDLGPDAPVLRADCASGQLLGAAAMPPGFAWARSGGSPPERALWGLGWTFGYEKVGPMGYPNLPVILRSRVG